MKYDNNNNNTIDIYIYIYIRRRQNIIFKKKGSKKKRYGKAEF